MIVTADSFFDAKVGILELYVSSKIALTVGQVTTYYYDFLQCLELAGVHG